jgi:S1-C subfamily serine protease
VEEHAVYFTCDLHCRRGVYITRVAVNSPAARADLQQGDIITKIGDVALDETHSYINALFEFQPGDQVNLEIVRGTDTMQIQVTFGEAELN